MSNWLGIFGVIVAAAIVGGGSIGCLGTYIVGMRIPFIGIVMAHSALAGGILAYLLGLPQFPTALALALISSVFLSLVASLHLRLESNTQMSIIFSLMIGLAFLGMGVVHGDMTPLLGLMWGSLLFVRTGDLIIMSILTVALAIFAIVFGKELKAILFSRTIAAASGIPHKLIYGLFLILAAGVITANLNIVGGLMIYSLLTCPAAAAYEMCKSLHSALITSGVLGIISAAGGFWISYQANLPTGACITLTAVFLFLIALLWRRRKPAE